MHERAVTDMAVGGTLRQAGSAMVLLVLGVFGPQPDGQAASLSVAQAVEAANTGSSHARAVTAPKPSKAADQALDDAVASVVVVALTEQFDGQSVSVEIDSHDVEVTGARERLVSGQGRLRLGTGDDWIAFGYRTLYDTLSGNASYPAITMGGAGGAERSVPNDATLIRQLDDRVAAALSKELGGKPVWLQLDSIETFESGERYVRIQAAGLADFGVDGSTPARLEALYDRKKDAWLRLDYQLGRDSRPNASLLSGG